MRLVNLRSTMNLFQVPECIIIVILFVVFFLLNLFIFISVLPDIQIEDAGKSRAPLKMEMLGSSQKVEFDVET